MCKFLNGKSLHGFDNMKFLIVRHDGCFTICSNDMRKETSSLLGLKVTLYRIIRQSKKIDFMEHIGPIQDGINEYLIENHNGFFNVDRIDGLKKVGTTPIYFETHSQAKEAFDDLDNLLDFVYANVILKKLVD